MARPIKTGLDYFPLDVDFHDDDKVGLLTAEFNVIAEAILLRLLCKIYKNGYFYVWGEDERLLFCRWAGGIFVPNQVDEVVAGCFRRSVFDKQVFDTFGILTSRGIQKRFLQATMERKNIEIIADYWLLDIPDSDKFIVNRGINSINRPINSVNRPESTQSKVKESKVKKRREKIGHEFIAPSLPEFEDYFEKNGFSRLLGKRAFEGYAVAGWHDSKGNKILNWKQKCHQVWFTDKNKAECPKPRNRHGMCE